MVTSSNSLTIHNDGLHTGSAKRAAASGVAPLDASSKFAGLLATDTPDKISSGTYTGDAGANRAIPHGLGAIPSIILIFGSNGSTIQSLCLINPPNSNGRSLHFAATTPAGSAQTAVDATNFYVSAGADIGQGNTNIATYYWRAYL